MAVYEWYDKYVFSIYPIFMLKTSKLLTVTVPKKTFADIRKEAKKRQTTVSALVRDAFFAYTQGEGEVYSDTELRRILNVDRLSPTLQKDLDKLLG